MTSDDHLALLLPVLAQSPLSAERRGQTLLQEVCHHCRDLLARQVQAQLHQDLATCPAHKRSINKGITKI